MNIEDIRNRCRKAKWQPLRGYYEDPREPFGDTIPSFENPDYLPVHGHSRREILADWFDINEAWTSGGGASWLRTYQAVSLPTGEGGKYQSVVCIGQEEAGRRESGSPLWHNWLRIKCVGCEKGFEVAVPWRVPNVPEKCPECAPALSEQDVAELSGEAPSTARKRASPIKDAVAEAIEHFREQGDTALLKDVVARAAARISYSGKGRDSRATNAKRELKKCKDARIDGDFVYFD